MKSIFLRALCIGPALAAAQLGQRDDSVRYLSDRGESLADSTASSNGNNAIIYGPMYSDGNPNGFVNLGVAENYLMHEDIIAHVQSNFTIDPYSDMTYNTTLGSPRLRKALASYLNDEFNPAVEVTSEQLAIGPGLGGMIDEIAWTIADGPQDGFLLPRPMYNSFEKDLTRRSNSTLVGASFLYNGTEYDMDIVFDANAQYQALERAYNNATEHGINIKAMIIVNPHNPLGRCYTKEGLTEIVRFASDKNIHLFSDEIYAKSVYTNSDYPNATKFTSILELDLEKLIDVKLVHLLYGMSKDFSASGFRLGAIYSRNQDLLDSITGIAGFSRPPFVSQAMWAGVLEDKEYLKSYWKRYSARLTESFNIMRDWLEERGIAYYKGTNGGLFLWTRLVEWPANRTIAEYTTWKSTFSKKCLEAGLNVADGETYKPENVEKGWFRLTHSVGDAREKEGLSRLAKVLDDMKNE